MTFPRDLAKLRPMHRDQAVTILKHHEPMLRSLGLRGLSLFGSTARNDAETSSDVDIAVCLDRGHRVDLFQYAAISERLKSLLGRSVDLVTEPNRSTRLQAMIERDRVRVF